MVYYMFRLCAKQLFTALVAPGHTAYPAACSLAHKQVICRIADYKGFVFGITCLFQYEIHRSGAGLWFTTSSAP